MKEKIEIPVTQQIHGVSNQLNCSPLSRTICIHPIATAIPANPMISNFLLYFSFTGSSFGIKNLISAIEIKHSGILTMNTHCHDQLSVKYPPKNGPASGANIAATPYNAIAKPFLSGKMSKSIA